MPGTQQRYNLPDWIFNLDPGLAVKLLLFGMFGQDAPTGTGVPTTGGGTSGGATAPNQVIQIAAEQAIQAAVAKTATFTNIAAVASSTTTIPIGAFDIGILILTGTGTVAAVDWPVSTPLNIKGPLAATVALVLANPGTARVTYST